MIVESHLELLRFCFNMLFIRIKTKDSPTAPEIIWSPVFCFRLSPISFPIYSRHVYYDTKLPCDRHKDEEVKHFYKCRF